ncbi:hypothetical protein [Lysobacter gummosus]|uniref:hypothetical protein n=1 Tax=Lysobacter gummosus TaxID=262324 RepID=UPI003638C8E1
MLCKFFIPGRARGIDRDRSRARRRRFSYLSFSCRPRARLARESSRRNAPVKHNAPESGRWLLAFARAARRCATA